ncbi:MAG TPA: hypothetical protein VFS37_01250 [Conexibacter sp.]|nr:hypothetical protein [Conexibacter sp.]
MAHGISRRLALLGGLVALVGAALALAVHTPSANASPFCGGQRLSNYAYCYGAPRTLSGDTGYGVERSICIGAGAIWGGCSGGPGQVRTMNLGFSTYTEPWIEVNAAGSTIVYGETF